MAKLRTKGGEFLKKQEGKMFQDMLSKHVKAFISSPNKIGCM